MSYIIVIVLVIVGCGGCFMMYGECCCECIIYDNETPDKPGSELIIPETTSPIQKDHIEL